MALLIFKKSLAGHLLPKMDTVKPEPAEACTSTDAISTTSKAGAGLSPPGLLTIAYLGGLTIPDLQIL